MRLNCKSRFALYGFSLVEILVVLVLITLVTSMVFPNFVRLYERATFNSERDEILNQITNLGFRAYLSGAEIVIEPVNEKNKNVFLDMPRDWRILTEEPIIYKRTGVCLGGRLVIQLGEKRERFSLDAPYCIPEEQHDG